MTNTKGITPTCKLLGFFFDTKSSDLFNFTEPKEAQELEIGAFALVVEYTEILGDGSTRPASEIEIVVPCPASGDIAAGQVLPL